MWKKWRLASVAWPSAGTESQTIKERRGRGGEGERGRREGKDEMGERGRNEMGERGRNEMGGEVKE